MTDHFVLNLKPTYHPIVDCTSTYYRVFIFFDTYLFTILSILSLPLYIVGCFFYFGVALSILIQTLFPSTAKKAAPKKAAPKKKAPAKKAAGKCIWWKYERVEWPKPCKPRGPFLSSCAEFGNSWVKLKWISLNQCLIFERSFSMFNWFCHPLKLFGTH